MSNTIFKQLSTYMYDQIYNCGHILSITSYMVIALYIATQHK